MRVSIALFSSVQTTNPTVPVGATLRSYCSHRRTTEHDRWSFGYTTTMSVSRRIGGSPEAGDGETEDDQVVRPGAGSLSHASRSRLIDKELTPLGSSFQYCIICGTGDGKVECSRCEGRGWVLTRPGGAGVARKVGQARCGLCGGHVCEYDLREVYGDGCLSPLCIYIYM